MSSVPRTERVYSGVVASFMALLTSYVMECSQECRVNLTGLRKTDNINSASYKVGETTHLFFLERRTSLNDFSRLGYGDETPPIFLTPG
uniref:SFRICE_001246 n=1 Tax=Spodoptera frugiperda TaxID=7108 RepID=A0A2H1V6S8_SPOFR